MAASSVLILAGGISHERDVSLRSGRRLADALGQHGFEVTVRDVDADLVDYLADAAPDVVWPLLHGAAGEDGALFAVLELTGARYVGSPSDAAHLAWDKPTAKTLVSRAGVSTPESVTLPQDFVRDISAEDIVGALAARIGVPFVVKPASGGSAQGVTRVDDIAGLPRAMVDAYTYGDTVLVERLVRGIEVAVGVIDTGEGPVALPPVEIEALDGTYDFEARYTAGRTRFYAPARLTEETAAHITKDALTVHRTLGLGSVSRSDFIVDVEGTPWFLDVNVVPGLTETSLVPLGLTAAGHDLGWVYAALVNSVAG